MKVMVQNSNTREYLDADDRWTKDFNAARQFETSAQAIVHCVWHDVDSPFEVLLKFDEPEFDLAVLKSTSDPTPVQKRQ